MWSQMGLVIANSCLGNNAVAETAFEKLCSDYSGQEHISRAVCLVADNYRKLENHKKAIGLYQYALTNWPDAPFALWSQMGLVISNLGLGDYSTAQDTINKLRATFSEDKRIPTAACLIGDAYRRLNRYKEAVELYKYVVDNRPDAEYALWSRMGLAISKLRTGDEGAAVLATDKLRSDFSQDERLPTAVCLIADEYRKLEKHKKACEFYQYVVNKWPEGEYGMWSQMGLVISQASLENDAVAETEFEKLRTKYSGYKQISKAVCLVADNYRNLGKHKKACELYQNVLANWPDAEFALWSQMDLAISSLRLDDYETAASAVNKLRADFSKDERMPMAACMVADEYRRLSKHDNACELYQYVVSSWPNAEYAIWSQANLIKSYLALGDDTAAEAAVSKLLGEFSGNNNKAKAIHDTAYEFRKLEKYEMANKLDQYVIGNWPDNEQAIWAKLDMARLEVILGNHVAVQSVIDNLTSNFSAHPSLSSAIFQIGEQYYNKAFQMQNDGLEDEARDNFGKAVSVWERIITQMPSSDFAPHAYYFSGYCYSRLGEYGKAIEYYQKIVDSWPSYQYAWEGQLRVARCYEILARARRMPKTDAAIKICQACEKLLASCRDPNSVNEANSLLRRWNLTKSSE